MGLTKGTAGFPELYPAGYAFVCLRPSAKQS
jgi:hypothetical protein